MLLRDLREAINWVIGGLFASRTKFNEECFAAANQFEVVQYAHVEQSIVRSRRILAIWFRSSGYDARTDSCELIPEQDELAETEGACCLW